MPNYDENETDHWARNYEQSRDAAGIGMPFCNVCNLRVEDCICEDGAQAEHICDDYYKANGLDGFDTGADNDDFAGE